MSVLLAALASLCLQDSKPPEFSKFDVARERVGHKVIADALLKNVASAELPGAKVTAIYYDQDRELKRSPTVAVPKIPPGQAAAFKLETLQLPNFSRFEVYVETAQATFVYTATDEKPLPLIRPASGPRLTLSSHTLSPLALVVRNGGGAPADEPTARLVFKDANGGAVHEARVRLEKSIAASTEETFELAIPGLPPHAAVEVSLSMQMSDEIALPDPPAFARELQVRQCRAVRLSDGSARVSGVLANATAGNVQRIALEFQLGRKESPYQPPGVLKAGESRPFVFYVPGVPPFDSLGFSVNCDTGGAPGGDVPLPSSRRTASKRVEADRVSLPPPPKVVQEAVTKETRPPSVGTRGLLVVEGAYGKNNKYTGDHYLVRMLFLNEQGKPYQPEATVTFSLYDGDKHLKKAQRSITRASWGGDAARVNGATVDLETMAFDRKTQELWVCVHWSDVPWKKPRADITVEIPNAGTYTLKGIEKDWDFAPKWPDGK
jgi:hypothetical protein